MKPPRTRSQFFNYKGFFSLVLLGVVDSNYKFIYASVGASGATCDAQVFERCDGAETSVDTSAACTELSLLTVTYYDGGVARIQPNFAGHRELEQNCWRHVRNMS